MAVKAMQDLAPSSSLLAWQSWGENQHEPLGNIIPSPTEV